jgi:hypothetical protein
LLPVAAELPAFLRSGQVRKDSVLCKVARALGVDVHQAGVEAGVAGGEVPSTADRKLLDAITQKGIKLTKATGTVHSGRKDDTEGTYHLYSLEVPARQIAAALFEFSRIQCVCSFCKGEQLLESHTTNPTAPARSCSCHASSCASAPAPDRTAECQAAQELQ